jgi:hypothetical protein
MSNNVNVNDLFGAAHDEGLLGADALNVLTNVIDLGQQIQAGLGVPADAIAASEVILCSKLLDDSSSIEAAGNTQAVIDGANGVIDALKSSKQGDSILVYSAFLNHGLLNPYTPLAQATLLNRSNYKPSGTTPLYDRSLVMLGTVLAKSQEFSDNGVPCRTVTLIVTDGEDVGSKATGKKVAPIVADLLRAETHIVAAMGIGGNGKFFKSVFTEMGIPDQWILTPSSDPSSIRKAFQVFSQSAVRASQNAVQFSQQQIGGFGS